MNYNNNNNNIPPDQGQGSYPQGGGGGGGGHDTSQQHQQQQNMYYQQYPSQYYQSMTPQSSSYQQQQQQQQQQHLYNQQQLQHPYQSSYSIPPHPYQSQYQPQPPPPSQQQQQQQHSTSSNSSSSLLVPPIQPASSSNRTPPLTSTTQLPLSIAHPNQRQPRSYLPNPPNSQPPQMQNQSSTSSSSSTTAITAATTALPPLSAPVSPSYPNRHQQQLLQTHLPYPNSPSQSSKKINPNQTSQPNTNYNQMSNRQIQIDKVGVSPLTYEISQAIPIPPFANVQPTETSMKHQQPKRSRRKSKFTTEQDDMIVNLKKSGKSWVEIADIAKVGTYLAARNRYQVLIGQQGGGTSECGPDDVIELRGIVDEGEVEKWRYLTKEFEKATGKQFESRQIRELVRFLFWKDPKGFDVDEKYLKELVANINNTSNSYNNSNKSSGDIGQSNGGYVDNSDSAAGEQK